MAEDHGSSPRCAAHRWVLLADVMIASLAVAGQLTVLHHDRDFDRINQVYCEPSVERLVL
ncbi:MAG: hypothetical protein ACRDS9_20395 [Pseudonocardiaceae bacterium]